MPPRRGILAVRFCLEEVRKSQLDTAPFFCMFIMCCTSTYGLMSMALLTHNYFKTRMTSLCMGFISAKQMIRTTIFCMLYHN